MTVPYRQGVLDSNNDVLTTPLNPAARILVRNCCTTGLERASIDPSNHRKALCLVPSTFRILLNPRGPHIHRQAVFSHVVPGRDDKLRHIFRPHALAVALKLGACGAKVCGVDGLVLFALGCRWKPAACSQRLLSKWNSQEMRNVRCGAVDSTLNGARRCVNLQRVDGVRDWHLGKAEEGCQYKSHVEVEWVRSAT
jgi:hypothetical protein